MVFESFLFKRVSTFPILSLLRSGIFREYYEKPKIVSMDVGCGTNDTIPLFYDLVTQAGLMKQVHLYLVDQNPLWLSILSEKLDQFFTKGQDITKRIQFTLIRKRLERLHLPSPHEILGHSADSITFKEGKFVTSSVDILHLNSNMLYWFGFFRSDTETILSNLLRISKPNALMIITQLFGQPEPDFSKVYSSGFSLKEIIVVRAKDDRIHVFDPEKYGIIPDSFRSYLFRRNENDHGN